MRSDRQWEGIGCPVEAIDTPALLVDFDALQRNIERMAAFGATHGVGIRPHAKTHKTPIIAHMQIAAGAIGQCVQKVGEAEVLVAGGVADVLIANEVVGFEKLARLAALARTARMTVAVDNELAAEALAEAAGAAQVTVGVVVDVDVGQGRCGVAPGQAALEFGHRVARLAGLELRGLQGYHGAIQHVHGFDARADRAREANAQLLDTAILFEADGLAIDIVTGAGTGTYAIEGVQAGMTEIQPGSYIFMDRQYREIGASGSDIYDDFEPALAVLATVMSTPTATRVVTDAGLKALSSDVGAPQLLDRPGWTYAFGGDEHGLLVGESERAPIGLGEKVRLLPSHCDTTINLYDRYHVVRGGALAAVWPIAARGRTR